MILGIPTCYYCHDHLKSGEGNNPDVTRDRRMTQMLLQTGQFCCNRCNSEVVVPLRLQGHIVLGMEVESKYYWDYSYTTLIAFRRHYKKVTIPVADFTEEFLRALGGGIAVKRFFQHFSKKQDDGSEVVECDKSELSVEEVAELDWRTTSGSHRDRKTGTKYIETANSKANREGLNPEPALATPVVSEAEVLKLFDEPSKKKKERTLTAEQEQRRLTREANKEKERQKAEKDAFYQRKFGVKFVRAKASAGDVAK